MRSTITPTALAFIALTALLLTVLGCIDSDKEARDEAFAEDIATTIQTLKIENLLRDSLALAPDVEVIVSYLEVPTESSLPLHYHPGEEFVYVLNGSGELIVTGKKVTLSEGDLYKIPLKAEHSFATYGDEVKGVVFRVHEKGQPDRILVDQ